ncbi:DUF4296 domain-containing protein [Carboxylicivirga sp. A043]|uniref:DUF4296 domain-containing protein n=1 Tax=Carboxylicivirga litoralis TaxID=2816963 RepID=UPI0021CB7C5B|nr:DUF4296 domain-containing protein [Carboxylicivirga sp. A043]MCU4157892.1 DUF4296 domain-containing protein [Carboxylicivirga sp. A043]
MYRYFSIVIVLVALLSCSTRPRVPRGIAGEEKMAEVLADIYQVESVLGQTRLSYNSSKEDKVSGYYKYVLDEHEMTKAEFDTAMSWYSANPTVLSDVYEEVIEILSRRDAELKNKVNKEKDERKTLAKLPGKTELWKDSTSFELPFDPKDSLDNRIPFNVEVDSLSNGILRLYAAYQFTEGGFLDSAQMKMIACYADSTIDTVYYQIHKSFNKVNGNISHRVVKSKELINVSGFLFDHGTTTQSKVSIDGVKMTFIPTVGAEEIELH